MAARIVQGSPGQVAAACLVERQHGGRDRGRGRRGGRRRAAPDAEERHGGRQHWPSPPRRRPAPPHSPAATQALHRCARRTRGDVGTRGRIGANGQVPAPMGTARRGSPYLGHAKHHAGRPAPDPRPAAPRAAGARRQLRHHGRGGRHRTATFAEVATRAEKLAAALTRLGIEQGDRVGTFCWNNQGHLEAYLAIPCMGAVLHTLNIRLPAEQLAYVINHAEDRCIIVDASLDPAAGGHQGRAQDRRDHHRGGGGGHLGPRRDPLLRAAARRRGARLRTGPTSTSAPPRPCVTRAGRPAAPRASCTRTAPSGCTPWPSSRPPRSA